MSNVPEDFIFDDRDFALADQNETRKIWAEKYLEMGPAKQDAEHFALYRTCQSRSSRNKKTRPTSPLSYPVRWILRWTQARRFARTPGRWIGRKVGGFNVKKRTIRHHHSRSRQKKMDAVFFIFYRCRRSR